MIKDIAKMGIAATLIAAAPFAFAQTTDTTGTGTSVTDMTATGTGTGTTPGVPNTGAGGDAAANALVLAVTGLVALGGIGYLATRRGAQI